MQPNLLDQALERHLQDHTAVNITLKDRTSVQGRVKDFDAHVILLAGDRECVVYRHSVLKLGGEAVHKETSPEPRPAAQPRPASQPRPSAQPRPAEQRRPKPKPKMETRPPNAPRPQVKPAPEKEAEAMNPLAEKMQKWLKSQQGGG